MDILFLEALSCWLGLQWTALLEMPVMLCS